MARYAFSDIHGNLALWNKIKEYITSEDEIYCLGDCADRGSHGATILFEVLNTDNITYIKGNHDDMLVRSIPELIADEPCGDDESYLWFYNGGGRTWDELGTMSEEKIMWIYNQLKNTPTRIDLDTAAGHIILTHAGTNPWYSEHDLELMGIKDAYIWDRKHLSCREWSDEYSDTYCVFGHTPTCIRDYFGAYACSETNPRIVKMCDGHKICIDLGAVWTHRTCLLDLDTLEPIYLDEDDI